MNRVSRRVFTVSLLLTGLGMNSLNLPHIEIPAVVESSSVAPTVFSVVPEPGTLVLIFMGLVALYVLRRWQYVQEAAEVLQTKEWDDSVVQEKMMCHFHKGYVCAFPDSAGTCLHQRDVADRADD